MRAFKSLLLPATLALALGACGGGSDGTDYFPPIPPQPKNEVPGSALVSAQSYTEYSASLAKSESADPVDVNNVTNPPKSETAEPATI